MDPPILTGATLIDGTGAEPARDRAGVIERGRIGAVVRGRREGAAAELALDGLTLLPGLINCHVHFFLRGQAEGPDDVRKAARGQLKAGADVIKLFARGGVMTRGVEPGSAQLTPEEIRAGVEEAKKAGRRTAAHAQATDGIAACVEAGIGSIEHGIFLTEAIAAKMVKAGIALVATLIAPERIVTHGVSAGVPEFAVRKSEAVIARHLESFQLAMHHGVPIAAGTDAGTPFNPHGSIVPELALMVKAGMSPLEAIRAATSTAARVLGLHEETGRIAPGLAADLIAVAGDPGERIEALDAVRLVIANGRIAVNRLGGAA